MTDHTQSPLVHVQVFSGGRENQDFAEQKRGSLAMRCEVFSWGFTLLLLAIMCSVTCCKSELLAQENTPTVASQPTQTDSPAGSLSSSENKPHQPRRVFSPPQPKELPSTCSAVLVVLHRDGESFPYLGYVIKEADGISYVSVRFTWEKTEDQWRHIGLSPDNPTDSFSIYWGEGKSREVKAELLATYFNRQWILSAPAEQMPPPLAGRHQAAMKVGNPIRIVGYETANEGENLDVKGVVLEGKILEDSTRNADKFSHGIISRPPGEDLDGYAVFNTQGNFLGQTLVRTGPEYSGQEGKCYVSGHFFPQIFSDRLLPDIGSAVALRSSNESAEPEFQVFVRIDDPLRLLNKNVKQELVIELDRFGSTLHAFFPYNFGPYAQLKNRPQVVPLIPVELSAEDQQYVTELFGNPSDKFLTAKVSMKLPREQDRTSFTIQLLFSSQTGEQVYGRPIKVSSKKRVPKKETVTVASKSETPPKTTEKPPTALVAELKAAENGEVKITSAFTASQIKAVKPENPLPESQEPASDAPSGRLATEEEIGKLDALILDFDSKSFRIPKKCGAFSADGKFIYLLDPFGDLRKLRTEDLSCVRILSLPENSRTIMRNGVITKFPVQENFELILTHAGLVISFENRKKIWIIDPESLNVLREIPIEDPRSICGNLTTDVGFCVGIMHPPRDKNQNNPTMFMIDYASGDVLHNICMLDYGSRTYLQIPTRHGVTNLQDLSANLEMSADGQKLVLGGRAGLALMRVENKELIYETSTPPKAALVHNFMGCSAQGEWVMANGESVRGSVVYNTRDLDQPAAVIPLTRSAIQSVSYDRLNNAFLYFSLGKFVEHRLKDHKETEYLMKIHPGCVFSAPKGGMIGICGATGFALVYLPGASPHN